MLLQVVTALSGPDFKASRCSNLDKNREHIDILHFPHTPYKRSRAGVCMRCRCRCKIKKKSLGWYWSNKLNSPSLEARLFSYSTTGWRWGWGAERWSLALTFRRKWPIRQRGKPVIMCQYSYLRMSPDSIHTGKSGVKVIEGGNKRTSKQRTLSLSHTHTKVVHRELAGKFPVRQMAP